MVFPVIRKCRRYSYLILGAVLATVTVTLIFPDPMVITGRESIGNFGQSHRKLSSKYAPDEVPALHLRGDAVGRDNDTINNIFEDNGVKDVNNGSRDADGVDDSNDIDTKEGRSDDDQIQNSDKKKVTKVIILTYMRSGSTLTGDFFQHHPDVFYMFEPLWRVQKYYNNRSQIIYNLKGETRRHALPNDVFWTQDSISTQTIQNVLDCRLANLDIGTLSMVHLATSKSTKPFHNCIKEHPIRKSIKAIIDCFSLIQTPCNNAKVTIVKTIRYTITQLEELLAADPDVKVIHLFRDPRGTFLSQYRVGEFMNQDRKGKFGTFCSRMLTDLKNSIELSKRFRDRILIVRYEDIVQYPIASAKFMYDFVGLPLTDRIKEYIWNITYAGHDQIDRKECPMLCTVRANSTNTAYQWRFTLPFGGVQWIDSLCWNVHHYLGYRLFHRLAEFKSLDFPSISPDFGDELKNSRLMTLKELALMPESKRRSTNS